MHLLWILACASLLLLHLQHISCDDLAMLGGNSPINNNNNNNNQMNNNNNNMNGKNIMNPNNNNNNIGVNSSLLSTILSSSNSGGGGNANNNNGGNMGAASSSSVNLGGSNSLGPMSASGGGVVESGSMGVSMGGGGGGGRMGLGGGSLGSHIGGHGGIASLGGHSGHIGLPGHVGSGHPGMPAHPGLSGHPGLQGQHGIGGGLSGHSGHGGLPGHALAGLAGLGIVVPGSNGYGGTGLGLGGGMGGGGGGGLDRMGGGQSGYYEHFISEHTVMAVFTSQGQVGGPCRFMPATRRQNHQCRKEFGLPDTIREARRLATSHCEDQFRYDRWNCSIETRGKRNIFKKLYKETAFVHALTAAAMTHSIARACADGRMTKCSCGPRKKNRVDQDFQWGGCNDNLKHGKRVTRSFLDLRGGDGDEVTEILRHDSEVGIEAVSTMMKDKCKCHGVSGSCSMKTCWKKMADFNATAALLRQKYNQAIRKAPNTRTMRREAPSSRMKKPKPRRKKQQSQYTTLYYLETSPTYCSVTKDRQCLHPDNCATLCCGRGYTTRVFKQVEKCRCRFNNGRCCQLICDYCQRYEDRYFCK